MPMLTALCILTALYVALGVFFAYRGSLGFMVDLHVAMVKQNPAVPRWKLRLYASALRLGAVIAWPIFIWRG